MALYIGEKKVNIHLNDILYKLNVFSSAPITNNVQLISSDGYILQDINSIDLMSEQETLKLITSDNQVLCTIDGLVFTVQGEINDND